MDAEMPSVYNHWHSIVSFTYWYWRRRLEASMSTCL